jgi:hypothetical protein
MIVRKCHCLKYYYGLILALSIEPTVDPDGKAVGTSQSVYPRTTGWKAWVRFSVLLAFYLPHSIQTGSGVHPVSYPKEASGNFPGNKAAAE